MNRKEKEDGTPFLPTGQGSRPRESQHGGRALSSPSPARRSRESSSRLHRTGDDLEGLYNEGPPPSVRRPHPEKSARRTQGNLPLTTTPKITVAEPAEIKPAPKVQPFAKIATPPTEEFKDYQLPGFELLHYEEKPDGPTDADREEMLEIQQKIIETLTTFRVDVTPGDITRGPTITRYEVYPARGVRVNTFDQYSKDIALATRAESVNIVAPIPGKDTVGIEIVNRKKWPCRPGTAPGPRILFSQKENSAGPGQGRVWPHRDRRPGLHAPPAGGGGYGFRQIRVHQQHYLLHAVEIQAG